jgi:hypothetical protein
MVDEGVVMVDVGLVVVDVVLIGEVVVADETEPNTQ